MASSKAQIDTSFWFAAPWVTPDHWWKDEIKLHISTFAAPTTTVRVRQPAIMGYGYDTTIVIPAYTTFDYLLWRNKLASAASSGFDSLEVRPSNTVVPYGLYLSSSDNVTVIYDEITRAPSYLNPETFSLKGRNGLGTEFYCPFQTKWSNKTFSSDLNGDGLITQPRQQINLVASMPNTVVWITPKCNVVGHAANVSYSLVLNNAGDAYTVENATQATTVAGNNLSGTHITSDKPISITVADDSVAGITGCYDLMGDQVVPVTAIGTDYVLNKGNMNATEPEGAYLVATENLTQITVNDGVVTTTVINQGDSYHYTTMQPVTYINASKNIYCLHATGFGCELGEALLPPLGCAGSSLVAFSRNTAQNFYLNIICKNGSQNTFTLNNNAATVSVPIAAANFTLVPGTATLSGGPYFGAHISLVSIALLPTGSYTIGNATDNFALGVFDGGATTGGLYHYMSLFAQQVNVSTGTVAPICVGAANNTVALSGTVAGGAATGVWTTSIGSGTFAPYTSNAGTISTVYTLSAADTLLNSLTFYLISAGSCQPVTDSVTLQINHRPGVLVGPGMSMCKNNLLPIVLTATITNATGGTWSGGLGGSFGAGINTTYTPSAADLALGTLTLYLGSQGSQPACLNTVNTVTISFLDPPLVFIVPPATSICRGSSAVITATGAATYSWNTGASVQSLTVSPILITNYTVTGTAADGCQNTMTALVSVNALPPVSITGSAVTCLGSSITLTASGASSYTWNPAIVSNTLAVSPTVSTSYTVTGTDANGCKNFSVATIAVNPLPDLAIFSSNTLICQGEPVTLTGSGASSYTWNTNQNSIAITVSPATTTLYTLSGTGVNGCINSSSFTQSVAICLGVNSTSNEGNRLMIYPNPNGGAFTIESNGRPLDLRLVNELGQPVRLISLNSENAYKLYLTNVADGIYFVYGTNGTLVNSQKIIIAQ